MTTIEIRQRYLDYMQTQGHHLLKRASLVLSDDATTLFTGSGMQPLLPYLLGETHPDGQRLANSQICLRTQDIAEVGDLSHTTCFEMLGNWSLGDYFKQEQLTYFFNFLVDEIGLDPQRIYTTCFRGSQADNLPKDEESAKILQQLYAQKGIEAKVVDLQTSERAAQTGMMGGRIFYYDDAENWWSRGGGITTTPLGDPCGGDCEFFFDFGEQYHDQARWGEPHPASDSGRFLEVGNSVFMEYKKQAQGFLPLTNKNVDFGGGLERLAAASGDYRDVFKIDLLWPLIQSLSSETTSKYDDNPQPFRIIVDHLRASAWLALDGVVPSNKEQGYVLRRLLRRALLQSAHLGINNSLVQVLLPTICQSYGDAYPEFITQQSQIMTILTKEETTFKQTLTAGIREFKKMTAQGKLAGTDLFKLYDTYGFPKELSLEQAQRQQLQLDANLEQDFNDLMQAQRQRSQTAQAGEFKSGLADHTDMTVKYHTATHLLYKALRLVLGEGVKQRGSNITAQRLRFDFSHPCKVEREQLDEIEQVVNQVISQDLAVSWQVMQTEAALAAGALGVFGDKYGDQVKVYSVGEGSDLYSQEICGGPHVARTGELSKNGERFKITKEESVGSGVRRIKAILET